jgi:hemerythrin-like domain-containing protein
MADVFTVLAKDHQEVKNMLAELAKGPTRATGASQNHLALRKKMTQELIIEESKHEALEEMYLWPAVREHLTAGNTLADEATGQEQEAKQVLADLDKLDASDADFEKLLAKFTVAARQHIEFEETQVWPGLRAALTAETAAELGTKIADGKSSAPTRPHPHTPPTPGALKTAGPVAAATDKVRDTITGRGTD